MLSIEVRKAIEQRIATIKNKEEFDEAINIYKTSNASNEIKKEAVDMLKKEFPQYVEVDHTPSAEVAQMMEDGKADISDITGFN